MAPSVILLVLATVTAVACLPTNHAVISQVACEPNIRRGPIIHYKPSPIRRIPEVLYLIDAEDLKRNSLQHPLIQYIDRSRISGTNYGQSYTQTSSSGSTDSSSNSYIRGAQSQSRTVTQSGSSSGTNYDQSYTQATSNGSTDSSSNSYNGGAQSQSRTVTQSGSSSGTNYDQSYTQATSNGNTDSSSSANNGGAQSQSRTDTDSGSSSGTDNGDSYTQATSNGNTDSSSSANNGGAQSQSRTVTQSGSSSGTNYDQSYTQATSSGSTDSSSSSNYEVAQYDNSFDTRSEGDYRKNFGGVAFRRGRLPHYYEDVSFNKNFQTSKHTASSFKTNYASRVLEKAIESMNDPSKRVVFENNFNEIARTSSEAHQESSEKFEEIRRNYRGRA